MDDLNEMNAYKENYWNKKRVQLLGWFEKNAPSLGELYKSSLRSLYDASLPARFHMLGHAVREIRNRLPDLIEGISKLKIHYDDRLDKIIEALDKNNFDIINKELPNVKETEALIPVEAYKLLKELLNDHVHNRQKGRKKIIDFFIAMAPEDIELRKLYEKMISDWYDITEEFMRITHINSIKIQHIDEKNLEEMFLVFENTLYALLCEYFETKGELNGVLEEANKRTNQ